jgi:sugar phosphate isomerase/epimerase
VDHTPAHYAVSNGIGLWWGVQIGICEWTTFPASFDDELAAYRAAGAAGIGILEFKIADDPEAGAKLRASGLAASNCLPAVGTILPSPIVPGPPEPEARVDSICESVGRLGELEPACVFFLTGPSADPAADRETVLEGIRRVAEAGERCGVRVALEPIHRTQAGLLSFVGSVREARALVEAAGAPSVGVLFDTWQLWDGPDVLDEIGEHAGSIYGVHVADRREPTRGDFDRALPGEGVIPLGPLLRALDEAGFDGFYDVELFSDNGTFGDHHPDSLWDLEPGEAARRAVDSLRQVWEAR